MSSTRRIASLCLLSCAVVAAVSFAADAPVAGAPSSDTVIATQGTAKLTFGDIDAFAARMEERQRPGFFNSPKRLENLVSTLLVTRQLATEAEQEGLEKDPAVQAQIRIATEEILSRARMEHMRSELKLPDFNKLAKEQYVGHKEKYAVPARIDVKHVLISTDKHTDEEAKTIAEDVQKQAAANPGDFDALVEKYSEDTSKPANHGLMPDVTTKRYAAPFAAAAAALKVPGEISPVVKTKFGYHVVKLVTRTSESPQTFEQAKPQIVEQLRTDYITKQLSEHTDTLRNGHIDANPELIASLRDRYGAPPSVSDPAATASDAKPPQP
ncbi:MAG: peptidylprolyl isomerase [Rhodanobacteraceae bacterium]